MWEFELNLMKIDVESGREKRGPESHIIHTTFNSIHIIFISSITFLFTV